MTARLATAFVLAVTIVACGRTFVPPPTPADAQRAQDRFPGTTTAELDHGRTIYLTKCTACHQPVDPTRFTPVEWEAHLDVMKKRAHLDDMQASLVERYLITMSQRGVRTASR
jgi:cytochrome c5